MRLLPVSVIVLLSFTLVGIFFFATEYDWVIDPPDQNYQVKKSIFNDVSCKDPGYVEVFSKAKRKPTEVHTGGGGDQIGMAQRNNAIFYDSSSPVTIKEHDFLTMRKMHPSEFKFLRHEHSLIICSNLYEIKLLLVRQYCYSAAGEKSPAWNNQFEEISFPGAREVWLEETLYQATQKSTSSALNIIKKHYKEDIKIPLRELKRWKFKPFESTLPHRMWATYYCIKDNQRL